MLYDRIICVSVGSSRLSKQWQLVEYLWSEFIEKLRTPTRTPETVAEYHALSKQKQGILKDVGGFVGGRLDGAQRKAANIESRDLITLDLDSIGPGGTEDVLRRVASLGVGYVVYSTRSHTPHRPRLRAIFLLDRAVSADEYEPMARRVAKLIGIDMCDPTTFEASRLMFWPSCPKDAAYVFDFADAPMISADGLLGQYRDWRDVRTWPQVPGAMEAREKQALSKQADPTKKPGVVGAFCRTYNILDAIERFLPHAYSPAGASGRLTFATGSTVAGAVLYDDNKFLYSHHATDPISGQLVNAFDLVRIHKFGALDEAAKEGTPSNKLPSYVAMAKLALADEAVALALNEERAQQTADIFREELPEAIAASATDVRWMKTAKLQMNDNGKPRKTMDNVIRILQYDPMLKGKIALETFAMKLTAMGALPWDATSTERSWTDTDDAGVLWYLEYRFDITGKDKILSALLLVAEQNAFNVIARYLNGLSWDGRERLDTLFSDYLGAEDTPYTRAVARKSLTAAVARVMAPGCKYDYVPVLVGRQGLGKSTLLRTLAKDWFSDSFSSFDGKDALEGIQGKWIIEMAEMTGYTKSEENMIKQFLSRTSDFFRKSYGRHATEHPRQCVFFGSSNNHDFLKDVTGNRRFWPIGAGRAAPLRDVWKDLPKEVDQIWAEAVIRFKEGEALHLDNAELISIATKEQYTHREVSIKEGMIREFIQKPVPKNYNAMSLRDRKLFWSGIFEEQDALMPREKISAIEIWCECFDGEPKTMRRSDAIEINQILDQLSGVERCGRAMRFGIYGVQKGFLVTGDNEKEDVTKAK